MFDLRSILSPSSRVPGTDARNARKALGTLGYYSHSSHNPSDVPDTALFEGIRRFQSDHGLKRDGVMKPGGETARTLGGLLARKQARRTTVKPGPGSVANANTRSTDRPLHAPLRKSKKPLPTHITPQSPPPPNRPVPETRPLPELDDAAFSSNQRTVNHLRTIRGTGDLSRFTADAINTGGDRAMAEVSDLIDQVRVHNPHQADELYRRTAEQLSSGRRKAFDTAILTGFDAGRPGHSESTFSNSRPKPTPKSASEPATDSRATPTTGHKTSSLDHDHLPMIKSRDLQQNQQVVHTLDALKQNNPVQYQKLGLDVQTFHQAYHLRRRQLSALDRETAGASIATSDQAALEHAREAVAGHYALGEIGKTLIHNAADVLEGGSMVLGLDDPAAVADIIRVHAPEGVPEGMDDTRVAASSQGVASALEFAGLAATGPAGIAAKITALTAAALPMANDTAKKVRAAGGTEAQARWAARLTAGTHAAVSVGGSKLGERVLSTMVPKLTNDLIATEIAGEVGSMSAGAVVEFVRDQLVDVFGKPLE